MDDETSSRYIFFFMLLLIPFLVIDLKHNANSSRTLFLQAWASLLPRDHFRSRKGHV